MADSHRRTEEGFRRLIAFTDAVVAIALTLLVLPLVDIAHDLTEGITVWQVFSDHSDQVIGFLISFIVIWVLWRNHHSMMEYFRSYDEVLFRLHFLWLFTIVALPFVTALISGREIEWANLAYLTVLWVSIASLSAMALWGRSHRALLDDSPETEHWLAGPPDLSTIIMLTIAMVVTAVFHDVGMWSLLLLLLSGPLHAAVAHRWRARR
ncbi:TMEM175 family protein [Gordonia sp. DT30]|uniref:TMEM175 family protein n=1 Tax=Gordonia sp. DT30 TaxID=3416546 RepID=UPI003CEC9484